jgi:hypothetical protein
MVVLKRIFSILFEIFLYIFALIGFVFTAIFIAMQFGWLNVQGSAKERDAYFEVPKIQNTVLSSTAINAFNLTHQEITGDNHPLLEDLSWMQSPDWQLLKEIFTRDQDVIKKSASDAGISPRLLLGGVIGEQLRFFSSRREAFKQYFEPLKVLASLSQFSFGIAGLKPNTVAQIEVNLKNSKSPFYLGADMEHVADYPLGADVEAERFARITNTKNPYYPYLYVGLFMRQVEAQWANAGFPIYGRPEILATLYNLGFNRSIPKEYPASGGAPIVINGQEYLFGEIAYQFYYSDELLDIYPRE